MKKFTNLLLVGSLALAGAVMAQQPTPEETQPPGKNKGPEKKQPAEVKPAPSLPPKPQAPAMKEKAQAPAMKEKAEAPAMKDPAASESPAATKPDKKGPKAPSTKAAPPVAPETKAQQPAASSTPAAKKPEMPQQNSKDMKAPGANANTSPSTTPAAPAATTTPAVTKTTATATPAAATTAITPAAASTATPATAGASATPAAAASASVAPSVAQTSPGTSPVNPTAAAKKPDQQKVQQIQQQHMNFRAQPRLDIAPAVTFTPNYRIQNSERWQGPQYEVYRSYRPERHDQGWYRSHYQRVELIAGGYYYYNNGYWAPAWGYSPREEYYAYDAPIYVGKHAEPPDKVIANVQAVLKDMGYYRGEVDGLLGPLTRQALTGYQTDNGMTVTAVIDEPTLDSLNMG